MDEEYEARLNCQADRYIRWMKMGAKYEAEDRKQYFLANPEEATVIKYYEQHTLQETAKHFGCREQHICTIWRLYCAHMREKRQPRARMCPVHIVSDDLQEVVKAMLVQQAS